MVGKALTAARGQAVARGGSLVRRAADALAGWADDRDQDLEFMDEVQAATRDRGHRFAYILSSLALLFVVLFVIWAHFAVLDEVTRGAGTIIPSSKTQVIQNLEGGILAAILVREGEQVNKGDILVRIDNSTSQSNFEDSLGKSQVLRAQVARLEAELKGASSLAFPADLVKANPKAVSDQQTLFDARQSQLQAQVAVLDAQARQRNQEVAEMAGKRGDLDRQLSIAKQQQDLLRPLAAKDLVPQVEMLTADSKVAEIQGQLSSVRLAIPRLQDAATEVRKRIAELKATRQTEVSDDLTKARAELKSTLEAMQAGKDRVARTDVRSPVRGIVKQIKQNTIGGVVQPGQDIMEIVPIDDTLLVEARIRPSDVAFLHPNQKATVKITAYDYSIYGGLDATVEQISADTIQEKDARGDDKSFYRVYLRTRQNALHRNGRTLPIIPGMTASVEILTGHKSVLEYLMKPILKARHEAMRER